MKKFKSLVTLAAILAFNAGMAAAPADDEGDVSLINQSKAESFGAKMAKARAAKHKKDPAAVKAPKAKKARLPRAPRAPKIPAQGF